MDLLVVKQAPKVRVLGSSFDFDPRDRWLMIDKPKDFHPENRHGNWDPARHAQFNGIARGGLEALGYAPL